MKLELKGDALILGDRKIMLTDKQLEELGIKLASFDVEHGDIVYFIEMWGNIGYFEYSRDFSEDVELLQDGKICKDKNLMEQKALHQNLNDLLWKFTIENGWSEDLWKEDGYKWFIAYDYSEMKLKPMHDDAIKAQGTTYFVSEEIAQRAINEIVKPYMEEHPEFVW